MANGELSRVLIRFVIQLQPLLHPRRLFQKMCASVRFTVVVVVVVVPRNPRPMLLKVLVATFLGRHGGVYERVSVLRGGTFRSTLREAQDVRWDDFDCHANVFLKTLQFPSGPD